MSGGRPVEPTPDERRVIDAARDCPDRGGLVESSVGRPCGPKFWCLDREEPVNRVDCLACQFARIFPTPEKGPPE